MSALLIREKIGTRVAFLGVREGTGEFVEVVVPLLLSVDWVVRLGLIYFLLP